MSSPFESLPTGTVPSNTLPSSEEPTREATASVFNPELGLLRCFNSREVWQEMVACFFCEVDLLFPEMHVALQKGDLSEVGRLAHRLKGTVAFVGTEPATQAALVVEWLERHGGTRSEAEEAIGELEKQCEVLKSVLLAGPPHVG